MLKNKFKLECLKCGDVRLVRTKTPCPKCGGTCFVIKPTIVTKEK